MAAGEVEADVTPLPDRVDARWLEAEVASDRYLDTLTGLPRLPVLRQALARRTGGPPVTILTLTICGFGDLLRRSGHGAGERVRRELGCALRTLVVGARADVAVGPSGRFVVIGPEAPTPGGLRATVDGVVAALRARLGDALPEVSVAAGRAPSAAHAARALSGTGGFRVPTMAPVVAYAEPLVAVRSGRLRGLHVRSSADRLQQDLTAANLVTAAARDVRGWPPPVCHAVGTLWVDVGAREASSWSLRRAVRDDWLAGRSMPRLGLRVHPDASTGFDDLSALRSLAGDGVGVALAGLSTGMADPPTVDRSAFRELVLDPGLVAGAAGDSDDAALAWGLTALASWHGMLVTADGVDDPDRLRLAAQLGAWRAEGGLFGPVQPLGDSPEAWPPGVDLRPWQCRAAVPTQAHHADWRSAAGSGPPGLACRAAELGAARPQVRGLVRSWLEGAVTPAHVRHLLAADRSGPRWTLAEASLLVALVAV